MLLGSLREPNLHISDVGWVRESEPNIFMPPCCSKFLAVDYRRAYRPGATYFFTLVTEARRPILVAHLDCLRDAFRVTRKRHPFEIDAIVVLPDHLHAVWTLPDGDGDFSLRWREIKRR